MSLAQADETLLLPSKDIDTGTFLDSYSAYNRYTINEKKVNSTVLIYVTPWNKRGYELSETFIAKFDIVSPVWFQVLERKKAYTVTGIPNIDIEWMTKLRTSNSGVKIVPRFIFEAWKAEHFVETMMEPKNADACIANIVKVLQNHNFDGAVIEIWSQFVGLHERELVMFVQRICGVIHEWSLLCILVIPPPLYRDDIEGRFTRKHFDQLSKHVDYFSLMTYDYSPPSLPGPNSPIGWIRKCILLLAPDSSSEAMRKRAQILTGFNFYGMKHVPQKHHGNAISGHEFVRLVNATRAPFSWDDASEEHFIRFSDDSGYENIVYYPTAMSLARRISVVQELGTGIAIWEAGHGLDSFYSQL